MSTTWLVSIMSIAFAAILAIAGTFITDWVHDVNKDRAIITQLWYKDVYLNGNVKAAPVDAPQKYIEPKQ